MLEMRTLFASNWLHQVISNSDSWMGNEAWTEALEWPGAKNFHTAEYKNFTVQSTGLSVGYYKIAEGFAFMRVWCLYFYLMRCRCIMPGICSISNIFLD